MQHFLLPHAPRDDGTTASGRPRNSAPPAAPEQGGGSLDAAGADPDGDALPPWGAVDGAWRALDCRRSQLQKQFIAHLEANADAMSITVTGLPKREDFQLPIQEQLIVELCSK